MSLSIRPCTANDVDIAVPLMYQAGPDAYRYIFSVNSAEQALKFLHYSFKQPSGTFSFNAHQLILDNDRPLGIMGIGRAKNNFHFMLQAVKDILSFYPLSATAGVIYRGLQVEQVIQPPKQNRLYLYDFAVHESAQNKGLGSYAIDRLFEQAKAQGLNTVALDVAENNPNAQRLYERKGFKALSFRKGGAQGKYGKIIGHTYMEAEI